MIEFLVPTSTRRAAVLIVLSTLSLAMLISAIWRIHLSLGHMMWLDELYTMTLMDSPNLPHLWEGAARGVDGNPPFYMSLAWILTFPFPRSPDIVLRALNLACLAGTVVLVYRLGCRVAAPLPVAAALAILPGIEGFADFALTEVRTYALYLFLVTANLFLTLRVIERPTPGRTALLAGIGVLATLAHSFGGFYVLATACCSIAVCLVARDRKVVAMLALSVTPATLALAVWIVVSLPAQLAVAFPYGWIPQPDLMVLGVALTGSLVAASVLSIVLLGAVAFGLWKGISPHMVPPRAVMALWTVLVGYAVLTLAGWVGSHLITSFFVPRYFIPNLLITALALILVADKLCHHIRPEIGCVAFAFCASIGLSAVAQDGGGGPIPCRDIRGRFIEERETLSGLPVVAESPDVMLTRVRYAPEQVTLYPLDWQVVLDYPHRVRNNAMDYHIMEILREWAPAGAVLSVNVLTTQELVARYDHFLVLDESRRAWFDAFRARSSMTAVLVGEGPGCRLWDVRMAPAAARFSTP